MPEKQEHTSKKQNHKALFEKINIDNIKLLLNVARICDLHSFLEN